MRGHARWDLSMRVLALILLAGCTIHVRAKPAADPHPMPSAVLDRQDPGADTSQHPVLRSFTAGTFPNTTAGNGGGEAALRLLGDVAKLALDLASL